MEGSSINERGNKNERKKMSATSVPVTQLSSTLISPAEHQPKCISFSSHPSSTVPRQMIDYTVLHWYSTWPVVIVPQRSCCLGYDVMCNTSGHRAVPLRCPNRAPPATTHFPASANSSFAGLTVRAPPRGHQYF